MEQYSVLMSVYLKELPEYFQQSIQSMLDQTVPTNDFVLVCDGPLTPELDAVIDQFVLANPGLFQIVRLEQNMGIGGAALAGLKCCKNDLIAKMDSDDIARKDRCEVQLRCFASDPNLSIVGSQLAEFQDDISNVIAVRKVPILHDDIYQYAKRRMPFNNITVMYRRRLVSEVGGYSKLSRSEDYELFARLLFKGNQALNIDDILCFARVSDSSLKRRGTFENTKNVIAVRWKIHKMGYSSLLDFLIPCCGQMLISLAPTRAKKFIYEKFLRGE